MLVQHLLRDSPTRVLQSAEERVFAIYQVAEECEHQQTLQPLGPLFSSKELTSVPLNATVSTLRT